MDGLLSYRSHKSGSLQRVSLPRAPFTMGVGGANDLNLPSGGETRPAQCTFLWEPRLATWSVTASEGAGITANGVTVSPKPLYLKSGHLIEIGRETVRFDRTPEVPLLNGKPAREIELRKRPLVLGRSRTDDKKVDRLSLDTEEPSISGDHLWITSEPTGHFIRDVSKVGSLLNGKRFQTKTLVVGDRFSIESYHFEYTGFAIRQIAPPSKIQLTALHLTVKVGRQQLEILRDVNLSVEGNCFMGILGGSGQGKSTFMNALCGIVPATKGKVYVDGLELGKSHETTRSLGIGYVPQDDIVHRELTVQQAILFSAQLRLDPRTPSDAMQRLTSDMIRRLGLEPHQLKPISKLSGGQRKRVSIATELLLRPQLLFLDEPSSGLDPATEHDLMKLLRSFAPSGSSTKVICTTHVLNRAYLFDQVTFIHDGCLIYRGLPHEVSPHFLSIAQREKTQPPSSDASVSSAPTPSADIEFHRAADPINQLPDVYDLLNSSRKSGTEWEKEFLTDETQDNQISRPAIPPDTSPYPQTRRPGYYRTSQILLARQWSILKADPLNLAFLLAQPLLIGGLVGWVADDLVLRMFLCIVATLWFGCSNGAQQIIRELPIFRRERVSGLGLNAYLQSKYLFLILVTSIQALLLLLSVIGISHIIRPSLFDHQSLQESVLASFFGHEDGLSDPVDFTAVEEEDAMLPGTTTTVETKAEEIPMWYAKLASRAIVMFSWFFGVQEAVNDAASRQAPGRAQVDIYLLLFTAIGLRFVALLGAAIVSVALGLMISAAVRSNTQAVMWVPLILIPQILLGGFVVTRPEMSPEVRSFSAFVPSFAAQRVMDVANVFGQDSPRMANRIKIPVFVKGEKETIIWEEQGRTFSAQYESRAEENTSWQNLLVNPKKVGQHVAPSYMRGSARIFEQSVEERNDVFYPSGTPYLYTTPALISLLTLLGWAVCCYVLTILLLTHKQKGR